MIVREASKKRVPVHDELARYFAAFNLYTYMAHRVGKILHIRPGEILDTWGVAELIVAYGQYENEEANKNYLEWKALTTKKDGPPPQPKRYAVRFIGVRELEE